jgi:hypothetical protein
LELTNGGRYGLRVLIYLAEAGERTMANRISEEGRIPHRLLCRRESLRSLRVRRLQLLAPDTLAYPSIIGLPTRFTATVRKTYCVLQLSIRSVL